jgi:uncharacterized protein YqeY
MTTLLERLQSDLKQALLAGDAVAKDTLRLVIAALKNQRIEAGHELDDAEALQVLQKGVKTRQESVEQYGRAGRQDLVERESAEIAVIRRYLPEELGEDRTRAIVQAKIAELGITSTRDIGRVMKAVMAEHRGRIDGKLVQRLAAALLTEG